MLPSTVMGPMVASGLYSTHADPRIVLPTVVIDMGSPQLGGTYRRTRRCSNVFRCCQAGRCSQSSLVSSSTSKAPVARIFFVIAPLIARGSCSLSMNCSRLLTVPAGCTPASKFPASEVSTATSPRLGCNTCDASNAADASQIHFDDIEGQSRRW